MELYVVLRIPKPEAIQHNEPEPEADRPYLCFLTELPNLGKITLDKEIAVLTATKLADLHGTFFNYKVCRLEEV